MSKRALLLGFLGALFLCGFTFFNDMVIRGSFLVGRFLPFSILGTLMLFVLFVNPLLGRVSRRLVLTGRELAVVTGLSLFVCFIPGRGLMHHFTNVLMMPHHFVRTDQSWRSDDVRLHLDKVTDWRLLTFLPSRLTTLGKHSLDVRSKAIRACPLACTILPSTLYR